MRKRKERVKHSKGYWLLPRPDHPFASIDGYVPEHRLVVEAVIGRIINPRVETVHHKDENKTNNEPANLQLVTFKEHRRIHDGWTQKNGVWWKPCTVCRQSFPADSDHFHQRKTGRLVHTCKPCSRHKSLSDYHHYSGMERQRERRRKRALHSHSA